MRDSSILRRPNPTGASGVARGRASGLVRVSALAGAIAALPILGVASFAAGCGDTDSDASATDDASADRKRSPDEDVDGGPVGFDGAATPACIEATGTGAAPTHELEDTSGIARVIASGSACARSFVLTSTAVRRDNLPESPRTVAESDDRPSLQTKNDLFDAVFQLALEEAKENSVSAIKDGAFRNGQPFPCAEGGCFETGRKWNYVWTRDTSYAVDLGLAFVDPIRAKNSLDFKLSERRAGGGLEIVQDTGSGGSYPVSTDRSVWAIGARTVLAQLSGPARDAFRDRALDAAGNVIARDRAVVFDATDGLYRGEQSFLDWREQSYPSWTAVDVVNIASSKALSTNVDHLALLELAADLAEEKGESESASSRRQAAQALRTAIRTRFWLPDEEQFSTYVTTELDQAPARQFDLLGTSLAILYDVATPEQAAAALAKYPTLPKGPPVVFPQEKDTAIYHNRAIWPFVTAYWARAAKKAGSDGAFDAAIASLLRGAALNLSNMENLEVVSGTPFFADGAASGPVVNSQRQLWSVGGYIGAIEGAIFGVEPMSGGARFTPFMTGGLRRTLFANAESLVLNNVSVRDKKVTVVLRLPPKADGAGALTVAKLTVNGVPTALGAFVEEAKLASRNLVEVEFASGPASKPARMIADVSDYRALFAPKSPAIPSVQVSGSNKLAVAIDPSGEAAADITFAIYRDGVRVANDLPGSTTVWEDPATNGESSPSHCYSVESRYVGSKNVSRRAQPQCFWGTGSGRISTFTRASFTVTGGTPANAYGKQFQESWGDPGHTLETTITATRTGGHLIQAVYGNGAGSINTGITCAVKHVVVEDVANGAIAGAGYLVMPQRADWASWGSSSFVRANLQAGKNYRIRLSQDDAGVNMSAFAHFAEYTGGTGGSGGAFFRVNVAELKVLALVP